MKSKHGVEIQISTNTTIMNSKELSEALSQLGNMYGDRTKVVVKYQDKYHGVTGLREIVFANRESGALNPYIELLLDVQN